MKIDQTNINEAHKPYIIAELSANHGGDLSRAKESITKAAEVGVSAIKIQTYTPDTMTLDMKEGELEIGQACALINDIPTIKECLKN